MGKIFGHQLHYYLLFTLIANLVILLPGTGIAQEIYRFERLWPSLQQPWYFSNPVDIAHDTQGYTYIVDQYNNRIQKFSSSGMFITAWGKLGTGSGDLTSPGAIAVDTGGFVYVADTGNHRINKYDSHGTFVTAWGSEGAAAGQLQSPAGIVTDALGTLYVADSGNHRIQVFSDNGTLLQSIGGPEQLQYPADVALDAEGRLLIVDKYNNRVQIYAADTDGTWAARSALSGSFDLPSGIAVDADGSIYIADTWNHRIQKFSSDGSFAASWGTEGSGSGQFSFPGGLSMDDSGYLFVADTVNNRVQKFTPDGMYVTAWEAHSSGWGKFGQPIGITTGPDGFVYVADTANNRIQKFGADGSLINIWGKSGTADGRLNQPTGITSDAAGFIYVADTGNYRIQKFTPEGTFVAAWGQQGEGDGRFSYPYAITADDAGFLYVTDPTANSIQTFTAAGVFVARFGSQGSGEGQLNQPYGICADKQGHLYVADNWNHRIQKFSTDGTFIAAWGEEGTGNGQFRYPTGVDIDSSGDVYVADTGNHRVQKFSSDGTFITRRGIFGSSPGQLSHPDDIAVTDNGTLYVTDTENHRVQAFQKVVTGANNKAIIVAGGGPYPGNSLWDATQICANFAYRSLTYQGFSKDDIFYLSANTDLDLDGNGFADDVDDNATNAALGSAIDTWAADADGLILYLVDHGGDGTFRMGETEILTAADLDTRLDRLQQATSCRVIIVYEACESGSFVPLLTAPDGLERIILTSASPQQSAYLITKGSISFSSFFWTQIFNGTNLHTAFDLAQQAISYTTPFQTPMIDDNFNGIANEDDDGTFSQSVTVGNSIDLSQGPPVIGDYSRDITIRGANAAVLYAEASDSDGISRVWAVVRPPDYETDGSASPVQQLPSVELMANEGNLYQGSYNSFDTPGVYQISIYAMDENLNRSVPIPATVTVEGPLTKKALIVAGYAGQNASLQAAIENNAATAYDTLHFQGYPAQNIYFLAPDIFHQGVDGLANPETIEFALGDWLQDGT
ncbi:SMP-30/gluconolactonase/LRE family protein, partial [Thermodesulfobacteriota bacterium]